MEITPIGMILLIAGPILLFLRPNWLYSAAIFSLPFTATAVINVGSGVDSSSLQAPMYFGLLLLLLHSASFLWKMSFPVPRTGQRSLLYLGLFVAAATTSLIMPYLLDGKVTVPPLRLGDSDTVLHLTGSHITHLLYVIFGFAYAYLIVLLNQSPAQLRQTLKAFIAGSAFASSWALMEFVCKVTGIPYPAMIFNTGKAVSTRGFLETSGGLPRLASVAVEPSILAETLLIAIAIMLPYVFGSPVLFSKRKDRTIFALLVAVVCMSTSSTGYLGIIMMLLTVLILCSIRGVLNVRHLVWPVVLAGTAILLYITIPVVQVVLDNQLFSKSENGSAIERAWTIGNAYAVFIEHPILGIGWSSIGSYDLIMNIAANSGLFGLLTFAAATYSIFRLLYRSIKSRDRALGTLGLLRIDFGAYVALTVCLGTALISGIPYVFTYFWFVFGLAVAAAGAMTTRKAEAMPTDRSLLRDKLAPGV